MDKTVIVIGCYVGGLGVIRSFANKPVKIIALSYEKIDFAHRSKYVNNWYRIPHPRENEKEFIEFLMKNGEKWKGAVIFDTDDNTATSVSKNKKLLSKYYKIVSADWEYMSLFINKNKAWEIALKSDVPHPLNFIANSKAEFNKIKEDINFPCLLKPVRGHEFKGKLNVKNFEANNIEEYDKYVSLCLKENQEIMVQEIIPGPDTNLFKCMTYINTKNQISGLFFYNKIRQNPPKFGVLRVCISAPNNDEVERLFKLLLNGSGYKGFLTVEFKKDLRDGKLKFIEANVRMPRNIYLPLAAGVNFPWIIYKDLVDNEQLYLTKYNDHMYWIEIYSDLLNTIFRHSKEKYSLREYISPYFSKNKAFAIWDLKDPLPFILQTLKLPRFLVSKKI